MDLEVSIRDGGEKGGGKKSRNGHKSQIIFSASLMRDFQILSDSSPIDIFNIYIYEYTQLSLA
jgi:hypothetical protein